MFDTTDLRLGSRFLFVFACLAVTVAALKLAAPIMVPFVLASFLAIVTMPVMFSLRRRGLGDVVALVLAILLEVLVLAVMVGLVVGSFGALNERLPAYAAIFQGQVQGWIATLEARGIPAANYLSLDLLSPERILAILGAAVQSAVSVLKLVFLVGIILIFILAEATVLPYKFKAILGTNRESGFRLMGVVGEVQTYLWIKTVMSLGTGIGVALLCWGMDIDFPVLLGLLAFALNFIPNIGSLLASIPALLLALTLHGPIRMAVLALGYMLINGMFGNLLETHVLGKRMGLSPVVVVLSLIFWSWLWGPVGALLAVPLTMVLKIVLEHVPDLRWIAILMDKLPPQAQEATNSTGSVGVRTVAS